MDAGFHKVPCLMCKQTGMLNRHIICQLCNGQGYTMGELKSKSTKRKYIPPAILSSEPIQNPRPSHYLSVHLPTVTPPSELITSKLIKIPESFIQPKLVPQTFLFQWYINRPYSKSHKQIIISVVSTSISSARNLLILRCTLMTKKYVSDAVLLNEPVALSNSDFCITDNDTKDSSLLVSYKWKRANYL